MKSLVAVEIADDFIRAAEVSQPLTNKPQLLRYAEKELPKGLVGDSKVFDTELVSKFLNELWEEAKFTSKIVSLSIGGRSIIVRDYKTTQTDLKIVKNNLPFEAADKLPTQPEDYIIDFYPGAVETNAKGQSMLEGLLIAAQIETVESVVKTFDAAGLDVDFVDFTPFGISRAFRKSGLATGSKLLVNVRKLSTDIIGLEDGKPRMVRVVANGLTVRQQRSGRHSSTDVAPQAFSVGGANSVVATPLDLLITDVKNTIGFFRQKNFEPEGIYVSGDASLSDDFLVKLQAVVQIEVEPLKFDSILGKATKQEETSPELEASVLAVVGAAMRGLK